MDALAYLHSPPCQIGRLKGENADFIVREELGYPITGEGEFVALKIRKNGVNTLFVGEKLARFAGISAKNMSYAGLKDRHAITEQWFCLQMPGQATPNFDDFRLDGVEILAIHRHQRKIRVGSLAGNFFEILLRDVSENADMLGRLQGIQQQGFPNYFGSQRFGREDHNITQGKRWAKGEISVRDRKKRGFYLSALRSQVFNLVLSERLKQGLATHIFPQDILQLAGSHSFFVADEHQDLAILGSRLKKGDIQLTAPLVGVGEKQGSEWEQGIVSQQSDVLALMQKEKVMAQRRPLLVKPQDFFWQFEAQGLRLKFYLPKGSYATALVRELIYVQEETQ